MYPLNMNHKAAGGFAVANDAGEHKSLSDLGYEPKFEGVIAVAKPSAGLNVEQLKEALADKGIEIPDGAKKADLAALLDAA